MDQARYRGSNLKKPAKKELRNRILVELKGMTWAVWAFLLAAALNFLVALFYGSLPDLLACILIMVGMAGTVKRFG